MLYNYFFILSTFISVYFFSSCSPPTNLYCFSLILAPKLYVLIMSSTCFRGNPCSLVAWMSKNSLLEASGWVFVYELSGCGFETRSSHLIFRYCACFERGFYWHSKTYRVWIYSETRIWNDKNIQSNAPYR